MPDRISVVTTRTGDGGTTALGDGSRVPKSSLRIAALGDVDELNCTIGVWRAEALPPDIDGMLAQIQNDLFDLGGELSIPGTRIVTAQHVDFLDERLRHYRTGLGRLKEFILPAGSRRVALAHLARTVCRRAERTLNALGTLEDVGAPARQYLNRLSDLCFIAARVLMKLGGEAIVMWQHEVQPRSGTQAAATPGRPAGKTPPGT